MFSQCILHIGTEKTGTTTLQNFLAVNRPALRQLGYVFPSTIGMPGNRHLVTYAENDDRPDGVRRRLGIATAADLERHRRKVEKLLHREAAAADACVLLLSSEHCHSRLQSEEEVRRLHSLLAETCQQVSVKVYLRPQHELAISHYSTFLRAGYSGVPVLPAAASDMAYYDYQQLLDRWARVFGEANLAARIYCRKELRHGDIRADFLHQLGLDSGSFIQTPDSNRALSGEAQALLEKFNPQLPESERGRIVRRLEEIGTTPGARPSRSQVEQFLGQFSKSNEEVRKRWFQDRDRLFDVDLSAYPEKPVLPSLSEAEAAALLASLRQEGQPNSEPEATRQRQSIRDIR